MSFSALPIAARSAVTSALRAATRYCTAAYTLTRRALSTCREWSPLLAFYLLMAVAFIPLVILSVIGIASDTGERR